VLATWLQAAAADALAAFKALLSEVVREVGEGNPPWRTVLPRLAKDPQVMVVVVVCVCVGGLCVWCVVWLAIVRLLQYTCTRGRASHSHCCTRRAAYMRWPVSETRRSCTIATCPTCWTRQEQGLGSCSETTWAPWCQVRFVVCVCAFVGAQIRITAHPSRADASGWKWLAALCYGLLHAGYCSHEQPCLVLLMHMWSYMYCTHAELCCLLECAAHRWSCDNRPYNPGW
jgi:hypothetical protein